MDADVGTSIVRWTARFAVTAYVVRLLWDVNRGNPDCPARDNALPTGQAGDEDQRKVRKPGFISEQTVLFIWTTGCLIYLLHVAAAFHFIHEWRHADAYEHTARQTAAVTGWEWGGGLWINYVFTLWWPLDVIWSRRRGIDQMPRSYVIAMHAIVGFLMLNATVAFGPPWWRWAAIIVAVLILLLMLRTSRSLDSSNAEPG